MILRDYQQKAVAAIYDYFRVAAGNPVLELPTGSGKSLVQAEFVRGVLTQFPDQRILCLTHVKELVAQNHAELMGIWPQAPAGVYAASLNRRDTFHPVIFASIQSIYRRARELGAFNLIIIDECHLVSKSNSGMYRELLHDLSEMNPRMKVIGMSATPWRLDNGPLTAGEGALFTDLISAKKLGATLPRLVELGHLAPLVTPNEALPTFDTTGIAMRGGDFKPSDLAAAIEDQRAVTQAACESLVRHGRDRHCWIIFCSSVRHCHMVQDALNALGVGASVVTGDTPKDMRDMRIEALREGSLRALISVNVLSTGFNVRQVDLLAVMRPTQSSSLYLQQMGRGMRVAEGKTDCLVLDYAGVISTHGPVDHVTPPPVKTKGKGDAVQKECPDCIMLVAAGVTVCPFCGHEFPPPKFNLATEASNLTIMGGDSPFLEYQPGKAVYHVHQKPGRPDSLRVGYYVNKAQVGTQWICLHHPGKAGDYGRQWWAEFVGLPVPDSMREAVDLARTQAKIPSTIKVARGGKFPMVTEVVA